DQHSLIQVREDANTAANHGVLPAEWTPAKAEAGLKRNLLQILEGGVAVGLNHLVIRRGYIVAQAGELAHQVGEAIVLANRVGIAIGADGHGQLQVRSHAPFILEVNSQAVDGQRVARFGGEVLNESILVGAVQHTIVEIGEAGEINLRPREDGVAVIADVVAAIVPANLEHVVAASDGEIVNSLVLGDVASLG